MQISSELSKSTCTLGQFKCKNSDLKGMIIFKWHKLLLAIIFFKTSSFILFIAILAVIAISFGLFFTFGTLWSVRSMHQTKELRFQIWNCTWHAQIFEWASEKPQCTSFSPLKKTSKFIYNKRHVTNYVIYWVYLCHISAQSHSLP